MILNPAARQAFAADDRLHARPAPTIPADMLVALQSAHGDALACERLAHAAHDYVTETRAHGLVVRLAALLWPVTA